MGGDRAAGNCLVVIFQQLLHLLPEQGEGLPHSRRLSQKHNTPRRGRAEIPQDMAETTFEAITNDGVPQRPADDEHRAKRLAAFAYPHIGTADPTHFR